MTGHRALPALAPSGDRRCGRPDTTARFLRALPDPTRLRLLEHEQAGERTSADRIAYPGISRPRVSVRLSCLPRTEGRMS